MTERKPAPVTINGQTYTHKHKDYEIFTRQVAVYYLPDDPVVACIRLNESREEEFYAVSKGHFAHFYYEITEEQTDWAAVPVDAKIEVYSSTAWVRRYFAGMVEGELYYFADGATSYSSAGYKVEIPAHSVRLYKP
jgi:hypothetical protein